MSTWKMFFILQSEVWGVVCLSSLVVVWCSGAEEIEHANIPVFASADRPTPPSCRSGMLLSPCIQGTWHPFAAVGLRSYTERLWILCR